MTTMAVKTDGRWVVRYMMRKLGTYDGLERAWKALKAAIERDIDAGTLTMMALEEMVHVHPEGQERPSDVLTFYPLRDLASDNGWSR